MNLINESLIAEAEILEEGKWGKFAALAIVAALAGHHLTKGNNHGPELGATDSYATDAEYFAAYGGEDQANAAWEVEQRASYDAPSSGGYADASYPTPETSAKEEHNRATQATEAALSGCKSMAYDVERAVKSNDVDRALRTIRQAEMACSGVSYQIQAHESEISSALDEMNSGLTKMRRELQNLQSSSSDYGSGSNSSEDLAYNSYVRSGLRSFVSGSSQIESILSAHLYEQ